MSDSQWGHGERIVKLEGRVDRLDKAVFHGEGGVRSLVSSQAETNQKIDRLIAQLDTVIAFRWPIIVGLVIIVAESLTNTLGAPIIRRLFGLP